MKFIYVLTVPMSLAALTVMGGADGCVEDQAATCQARLQQMQFVGYAGCQDIEFCDGTSVVAYKSRSAGAAGYQLGLSTPEPYALPEDKNTYLNAWLYISEAGQVCARPVDQALIDQGAPLDKVVKVAVTLTEVSATGVLGAPIGHDIQVAVQALDFNPRVSNATHEVQLGGRKVAVFVQATSVTELKLQPNLTQTPSSGTISYELPEMPSTMTTVPVAKPEATVSVSQGIAVGESATVRATLEADGETIEREAEVRVVARSDDPILDIQQRPAEGCSARCGGEATYFHIACFTTAQSLPSADATQSAITWAGRRLHRGGTEVASDEAVMGRLNESGEFAVCYRPGVDAFTVRIEAQNTVASSIVAHEFELDPAL